ncbi:MAG TPA: PDZ domain-containing protein, partial [Thermoplasmatales archaeon]|nr:PDZ domain-containing protein [Thermoplasmatales archaeon]
LTYWSIADDLDSLEQRNQALQQQLDGLQFPGHNITYFLGNTSLAALYEQVRPSIVVIHGYTVQQSIFGQQYGETQGSGFIYNQSGEHVVVTNYHVVRNAVNITVTLCNGRAFAAEVLGSDPYADLAVLEVNAERAKLPPLAMTSSATLRVGDPVVAIGTPFGLAGTMTTGIVSHLGRTIRESTAGEFSIANIIQISTPINPGNSGGPLLNYQGEVVGITTAIVSESQGLGFAIPSATVLRELPSLVSTGSYTRHSWLGVTGYDMDYHLARVMGVNVTYGWLLAGIQDGGPADKAGLQGGDHQVSIGGTRYVVGGDVVVAIDNRSVLNGDDLMSYLAAHTLPGQTIQVTVVRHNETVTLPVTLGTRPPPPG